MEIEVGILLYFSLPKSTYLTISRSVVFIIGPWGLLPKKEPGYNYDYIYSLFISIIDTVVPPYPWNMFQDSQQMSETMISSESYIHYAFLYTYIPMINFN